MEAPSVPCSVIPAASLTFSNGVSLAHIDSVHGVPREDVLGEGAIGQVVRVKWNGSPVAVKALTADSIGALMHAPGPCLSSQNSYFSFVVVALFERLPGAVVPSRCRARAEPVGDLAKRPKRRRGVRRDPGLI